MILCSCTRLTRDELSASAEKILTETPDAPLTPGRVFRGTGRRIDCGECRRLIEAGIADALRRCGRSGAECPKARACAEAQGSPEPAALAAAAR